MTPLHVDNATQRAFLHKLSRPVECCRLPVAEIDHVDNFRPLRSMGHLYGLRVILCQGLLTEDMFSRRNPLQ